MTDAVQKSESKLIDNEFGKVTNKRVVYCRNKNWVSGGSREDIPLQHVTSVRLDTSRSIVGGVLSLLLSLGLLSANGGLKIFGVLLLAFAVVLLWGSPLVVVNTAGGDLNAAKGWPWHRQKAYAFVEALRNQLFNRTSG